MYGDKKSGIGAGLEGSVMYRVLPMADVVLSAGYSQLKYHDPGFKRFTNLINVDLKGNFEVISKGMIRPFVTAGLGIINFKHQNSTFGRFSDAAFFGGGGIKLRLNRSFDSFVGADYRFTTADELDDRTLGGKQGNANDGYLNVRAGVSYFLPGKQREVPQVVAMENVPFDQLDSAELASEGQGSVASNPDTETKDMEQYIKLKSRIDDLSDKIDSKEGTISQLRRHVENKKQQVASLSKTVSRNPSVNLRPSTNKSGFADIYEEALAYYYNRNYNQATSLFSLLLQQYPTHALAANCQYWIAECDYQLGRYQDAIDASFKVLGYRRSPKKDDTLFLLGKTYLKTGSGSRAKESFDRLLREYPQSEFVFEARDYLSKL